MSREDAQMKIRLPADFKGLLENAAKFNKRSLNAEILYRLRGSFSNDPEQLEKVRQHVTLSEERYSKSVLTDGVEAWNELRQRMEKSDQEMREYQEKVLRKLAELKDEGDGS